MQLEANDVWDLGEMFFGLMNFGVMSFGREAIEMQMGVIEEMVRKDNNLKEIAEEIKGFRESTLPVIPEPLTLAGRITILKRIAELKGALQDRLKSASVNFPSEL